MRKSGIKTNVPNKLFAEPSLFSPRPEKISLKDRFFSQKAKKMTRKTRTAPQGIPILTNKLKTSDIVISCGNVPRDELLNRIGITKHKVTTSQTINGPFVSPSFLDDIACPIIKSI